jgi:hypothetical protein
MNRIRKKGIEKISALLDIELNYSHAKHNFELGLPLEASLRQFFRPYFPSRYGFTSGYIVDDSDTESNQTDWIIFDSEYFSPLLAKIHGTEGAEWVPFDSVYGCVEVKRTLTDDALWEALEQIRKTRALSRAKTDLLQITPHFRMPEKALLLNAEAGLDEVCNPLYIGVYAFAAGSCSRVDHLYAILEEFSQKHGLTVLPDFIAVHGHYYVRRATYNIDGGTFSIGPFPDQTNSYITIAAAGLVPGVFYLDLIGQFANTNLSARSVSLGLLPFLKSNGLFGVTGRSLHNPNGPIRGKPSSDP